MDNTQTTLTALTEAVKTDEILYWLNTFYVECMTKAPTELNNISELTAHRLSQIIKHYDTKHKNNRKNFFTNQPSNTQKSTQEKQE